MKKMVMGRIIMVAVVLVCGLKLADAAGPVIDRQMEEGSGFEDDQALPGSDLLARMVELAEGAAGEDELRELLEHDPLVQAAGLIPGSHIMFSSIGAGDCRPSPLLCFYKLYTPDLRCVYNCIGLNGPGELTGRRLGECDLLAGCILFENCLALCISIIPPDIPSVIW